MTTINVNGPPTAIAGLPDASLPLSPDSFIPLDTTQSGPTVRTTLAQLAAFTGGSGVSPTSSVASAGGVQALPSGGGFIFVSNSTSALTLTSPTPPPTEGAWFWVMDASGTADDHAISFSGSLVGNATLIDVENASALLVYHSGAFYRLF